MDKGTKIENSFEKAINSKIVEMWEKELEKNKEFYKDQLTDFLISVNREYDEEHIALLVEKAIFKVFNTSVEMKLLEKFSDLINNTFLRVIQSNSVMMEFIKQTNVGNLENRLNRLERVIVGKLQISREELENG
jgi:glutamyl/glutaminyl-tRNA synthetase